MSISLKPPTTSESGSVTGRVSPIKSRKVSLSVPMSTRKLSARMDKEVADAFQLFDKDKDGQITRAEIEELVRNLGGETDCPHVQELLKASDNEGSVNLATFMQLWQHFKDSVADEDDDTEEEIKKAFKGYDVDGDGYITKDEVLKIITSLDFVGEKEVEAEKCLKDMDLDGDGRVSYAEFMVKWKIT